MEMNMRKVSTALLGALLMLALAACADSGPGPEAAMAYGAAAPAAKLIVDPNEGWDLELLKHLQPFLQAAGVDLIEQPLPSDADEGLERKPQLTGAAEAKTVQPA